MNFQIMQHAGGREFIPAINQRTKKPLIYDNAKEAAEMAAKLTAKRGIKFQPRPVLDLSDLSGWRDRERARFTNGEYQPVLWINEKWWKEIPDHFAHIGVKDKTRIAFTPDANKGEADRQTTMLPGKYLQQFFSDVLTAEQIREFAMQHANKFENNELFFATTPEEIQKAYKPYLGSSCFSDTTRANLYGSGDFAVAYIKDKNGKITGRTVCVPERKIYVYIYGDTARLGALLEKAGYKKNNQGDQYKGLRILKEWLWDGFYSDFGRNQGHLIDDPKDAKYKIFSR